MYLNMLILISNHTFENGRLPAWAKPIYPSDWIDRVGIQGYTIYSYTPQLTKFRSGYLLKDILDRCIAKVKNTLTPNLSVYVYSAHDYNIAMMLKGLGMWDVSFELKKYILI